MSESLNPSLPWLFSLFGRLSRQLVAPYLAGRALGRDGREERGRGSTDQLAPSAGGGERTVLCCDVKATPPTFDRVLIGP